MPKFPQHTNDRHVGAGEESDKTDAGYKNVLPEDPVEAAQAAVPLMDGINNGWCEETEAGEEDCAAEVDEEF